MADPFEDVRKTVKAFLQSRQLQHEASVQHARDTKVNLFRDLAKSGSLSDDWIEYAASLIKKDVESGSKKTQGRKRNETLLRDTSIAEAVHLGVTLGLKASRNTASKKKDADRTPSACSVVADELNMTEASVHKIWSKHGARFVAKEPPAGVRK
ncbi:hypothetical protein [Bradyrhizobium sp. JR18.2]|uniref:hypothetical protein n=1 Tax=Bradyrhizobium sp. JR18.2 TaxID=3156369 RepID=UPI003393C8B7